MISTLKYALTSLIVVCVLAVAGLLPGGPGTTAAESVAALPAATCQGSEWAIPPQPGTPGIPY